MHKPNRSFAKKVFAAGLAASTALWTAGALLVPQVGAVDAHPEGSLVLSSGTVWHIFSDGGTLKRHGVDSLEKFLSNRWSFAQVVPANSADLALADAGLMSWGSGVLFNDGGTVYQVSGGMKHGFTSAANFTGLGFKFSNVVPGSLSGVSAGAVIDSATSAHLEGTFVLSGGTVWTITATGRKGVSSPAILRSHGADFKDVVAANSADLARADEGLAQFRPGALVNDAGTIFAVTATAKRGFPTASCFTGLGFSFGNVLSGSTAGLTAGANFCAEGATPPTTGAGTLTVTLASDTPAAGSVVKNAARVGFTKVNMVASGGDVTIDSMVVRRTGVSTDSNFTDIILLDMSGGKTVAQATQVGNERSLGSTHEATFGDDITIKNGESKSYMIAANMASTVNAADQAKLELVTITLLGSATLVASLPIAGNTMTMNNNVAIATVTVANGGQNPSASTQNVGTTDYVVSSIKITIGSQEDVKLHHIRFFQNGTAADDDIKDAELLVDGSVVATLAKPTTKSLDFVFATPITIAKGNNKDFNLRVDIVGGSSRTISLDIDKKADIVAEGATYGYFRVPSYDNSTSPFYNAPDTTISVGTLTFSKGNLASLNVGRATVQPLGAFKTTVQGEAVRVTQLVIGVAYAGGIGGSTATVTNLVVKDDTGKTVAGPVSTQDVRAVNVYSATSTDTVVFPVGTKTYTVYGDVATATDANSNVTIRISGPSTLVTAKGEVTAQTITPNPTTDVTLDTVTVKGATVAVSTSTSPAAQTVVIGKQDFVFANIVVDASNSGEDIRVTQLATVHKTSANNKQTNITNLEVVVDGVALLPIVQPTAVAATSATSTFSFTNPIVVTKGQSKTLTVRGDINTGAANDTHSFGCNSSSCITAVGQTTGNSVTATVTNSDGQVMTLATTGTLTVSGDSTTPDAGFLVGGTEKTTVQVLTIAAAREAVDLTEIHFEPTAVNGGELNDEFAKVYLFDGSTQIASVTPTSTTKVTFQSLASGTFRISAGTSKKLTVKVDVASVVDPSNPSSATADSGDGLVFVVPEDGYAGTGVDSGTKLAASATSGTHTANGMTVYKSVPTWTQVALPTGTLVNTTGVVLYKFKVAADAKGDIGLYRFTFGISTTTATVTQFEVFEEPGTTAQRNLTNNAVRTVAANVLVNASDGKGGQYAINVLFDTGTDGVNNGGEFRTVSAGSSRTFQLTGTVASSVAGSSVSVVFRGDNDFTSTYPDCAGGATAGDNTCTGVQGQDQGRFVWSDLPFASTSSTATNTLEWLNGFRVPGMVTTSTALILSR